MTHVSKRNAAKKAMIDIMQSIEKADDKSMSLATKSLQQLKDKHSEFLKLHKSIIDVTGSAEIEFQNIELEDGNRTYNKAKERIEAIINAINSSTIALEKQSSSSSTTPGSSKTSATNDQQRASKPLDQNNTVMRNIARAIERLHRQAMQSNLEEAIVIEDMLANYWETYTSAAFSDWNSEPDDEFAEVEELYMAAKRKINNLRLLNEQRAPPDNNIANIAHGNLPNNDIKLPRIEIPKFSGTFKSWTAFYDMFSSLVHSAPHLTDVQRMHYLRSSVDGEAEQLIRSYKVTEANYTAAWAALKARYNNRRLIINAHLEHIINMPKCTIESPSTLRRLLDSFTEAVREINALDIPTENSDFILTFLLTAKLDPNTKRAWEMSLVNDEPPTMEQVRQFIERHCRSLEAAGQASSSSSSKNRTPAQSNPNVGNTKIQQSVVVRPRAYVSTSINAPDKCSMCQEDHHIGSCKEFIRLATGERFGKARELQLCFNCLRTEHITTDCRAGSCRKCGKRHHSLLHYDQNNKSNNIQHQSSLLGINSDKQIILATAMAVIKDASGKNNRVRILLDSGSQTSFVTEECAKRTGIVRKKASFPVSGLALVTATHTRGHAKFEISSEHQPYHTHFIHAFVLHRITCPMPIAAVDKDHLEILDAIPALADPHFDIPAEIDIMLGADIIGDLLLSGRIHDKNNKSLYAQQTTFGWVISGPIPTANMHNNLRPMAALTSNIDLEEALQRFWQLEDFGPNETRTLEEIACENHFSSTYSRATDGRFIVELPFHQNAPKIGNSKVSALKSLHQLERRFARQPALKKQYTEFIDEYIALGHMAKVTHETEESASFYLPHHPVFKPTSTTTKIRVVFDASRRTTTGVSLNDTLMVGPKLQRDLVDIMLRFRSHAIAFSGDLVKMYRQIRTTPTSSEYQRILWRPSPNQEIITYRLNTVTYGTSSASYLATRALRQLAIEEAHRYPLASAAAMTDFYVDDIMTGCDNVSDALALQRELTLLMESGGFTLGKWTSNSNLILESVPETQREVNCPLEIHADESVKALGLVWNPSIDCFQYRISLPEAHTTPTKRSILSEVASLFDPLGLLAPLIVVAKIFLQELWAEGVGWDQTLPTHLNTRWLTYRNSLSKIHELNIPRWIGLHGTHSHQLHGFCDASEAAYAAVVYLKATRPDGRVTVHVITARTRVAPIKKISLPRLELSGAVLLARLLIYTKEALNMPTIECHAWCDSTVTLAWIRKPSHSWQTFVANRVSAIHSLTTPGIWHHIPGTQNPADAASRGLTTTSMVSAKLWWQGPDWLAKNKENWPRTDANCSTNIDAKKTNIIGLHHAINIESEILLRFSTLNRLQRITVFITRFVFNCRHPKSSRKYGTITTIELIEATRFWIKHTQSISFASEIASCKSRKPNIQNKLGTLNPFIDDEGVLRVGGRIGHAHIPFDTRHPIILPKSCHISKLLVAHAHRTNLHGGIQLTVSSLRQTYWIISVRNLVKHHIHRCTACIRHKQTRGQQQMASLPERRLLPTRAFHTAGVDYAGPITIKLQPGRGTKTSKAYIALFVCFSTKALHLELVSSLTTDAFVAAYRRFTARRGKCAHLYSDCGSNFVGADTELRHLQTVVVQQFQSTILADSLASEKTQWHFNPPGAPSFGGIWEAGVKSVKFHLRRILGTSLLTFEELYTILTQTEAVLNSRPIGPMTDDINDLQPLTPGHFLIGEPMNTVPDPTVPPKTSPTNRWRHLQQLNQHIWNRWHREYLVTLQQRFKWLKRTENIKVGALALIVDENLPPARWAMARVVELHPGADGLVRVATLRHANGLIKRPLIKLIIFPNVHEISHTTPDTTDKSNI